MDFWIRVTSSTAGNVFVFMYNTTAAITIALNADRKFTFNNGSNTVTSTAALTLNTWLYVKISFKNDKIYLRINGTLTDTLSLYINTPVTSVRLGGFYGQLDEFCWKHSAESSDSMGEEYSGYLDFNDLGGGGNGAHGDVVINTSCGLNDRALITKAVGTTITVNKWTTGGLVGNPTVGDEVMIYVSHPKGSDYTYLGCYAFRRVVSVSGTTFKLDDGVSDEFPLNSVVDNYYVCMMVVPNFKNLTITENGNVTVSAWSTTYCGGLTVFRCSGDCTINGKIITSGKGPTRIDNLQLEHSKIIDQFVINRGGGVMIFCGGTFTASSTARIGAEWSGAGKGGTYVQYAAGGNGGAGYGGAGGSDTDSLSYGGNGGVGGGGGGHDGAPGNNGGAGGNAGSGGNTGGNYYGYGANTPSRYGGTQGKYSGGNGYQGGGGGAGGNGTGYTGKVGVSGANVIILAKTMGTVAPEAISTGGAGGPAENSGYQSGGGGTGFCYMAYEKTA